MAQYGIPGLAVDVIVNGQPHIYIYGMASLKAGRPVTAHSF